MLSLVFMRNTLHRSYMFVSAIALMATGVVANAQVSDAYVDASYGFVLSPPRFPVTTPQTSVTAVLFAAPASDGFAPNINVQVQRVAMSIDEFEDLTLQQFDQFNFTVVERARRQIDGREAAFWHYTGAPQGLELEFLALAVADGFAFYVITGTATPRQMRELRPELERVIDSFRPPE